MYQIHTTIFHSSPSLSPRTRYFFLWRSREDETADLRCAIIEARVSPAAFIDPRGSTWRGEDYGEPRRCRCVDCFIKFCATQTIFQQRRSIRAINQPVQWHRHGDPLHDSLSLFFSFSWTVARGQIRVSFTYVNAL